MIYMEKKLVLHQYNTYIFGIVLKMIYLIKTKYKNVI